MSLPRHHCSDVRVRSLEFIQIHMNIYIYIYLHGKANQANHIVVVYIYTLCVCWLITTNIDGTQSISLGGLVEYLPVYGWIGFAGKVSRNHWGLGRTCPPEQANSSKGFLAKLFAPWDMGQCGDFLHDLRKWPFSNFGLQNRFISESDTPPKYLNWSSFSPSSDCTICGYHVLDKAKWCELYPMLSQSYPHISPWYPDDIPITL